MSGKKRKKSSENLINSAVDDLSSVGDPETMFGPLLTPKKFGSVYGEDRTLPLGIESKSAILRPKVLLTPLHNENHNDSQNQFQQSAGENEATIVSAQQSARVEESAASASDYSIADKTIVVKNDKNLNLNLNSSEPPVEEKVSFGVARPNLRAASSVNVSGTEVQLIQAESLRIAQERMTELERENEKLRAENEDLFSASTMARGKIEELTAQLEALDRDRSSQAGQFQSELNIVKDKSVNKDIEINKLRQKVAELEARLKQDLRKIRVRERELENRLELTKMEKETLLRAKDEAFLDLKRKMDHLQGELEGYRHRVADLNSRVEGDHEQLSRTVRALRLALTNLESSEATGSITMAPLKKAE